MHYKTRRACHRFAPIPDIVQVSQVPAAAPTLVVTQLFVLVSQVTIKPGVVVLVKAAYVVPTWEPCTLTAKDRVSPSPFARGGRYTYSPAPRPQHAAHRPRRYRSSSTCTHTPPASSSHTTP